MECVFLKILLDEITKLSKEDWSTVAYNKALSETDKMHINSEDDYYQEVLSSQFENEIDKFEENAIVKFFESLNLSIIGGECFLKDFTEIINKLIAICGKLQYAQISDEIDEELLLSLEDKIKEIEPFSILKKCLIEYQSNANFLLRLVENPSLNTLFDLSDQTQDILDELKNNFSFNNNDLKKELLLTIKNNLILLRKDFYLKYEVEDLKVLLIAKNELENCNKFFKTTPSLCNITELLTEKSIFLIRKYIIRKHKEDNVHNENYVFLGKESNFDFISHKLKLDVFKDWDRYSKNHFLSEDNHEKTIVLNRNCQKILKLTNFNALDLHSLTKFYKDLSTDIDKLKTLLIKIDTIPTKNVIFDKFALNKIKNYISNNLFSEEIKNISYESNIEEIENTIELDIKKIHEIQRESILNNFFPYFKICHFLNNYIDKKTAKITLEDNESEESILCISKSLEILKKYFEIFKINLKWSKVHLNYSYQLPFSECLKKHEIDGMTINVFSASTFSLPIEFEKYDEFEKYTEAFLLRIENEIKTLNNLNSFVKIFKENRDELQEDIKNNSKKNIELLGIFSAIIALLFTGVTTAQNTETFVEKILTFISMFIVLISFLLLLHFFINHNKRSK